MTAESLRWVESGGGPLLLLPEPLLAEWHGAEGPSTEHTDYERACAVQDYLASIPVGRGVGLVLGDEPLTTAWLPARGGRGGTLVRWVHAPDDAAVLAALTEEVGAPMPGQAGVALPVRAPLVLFDSAYAGRDLPPDRLRIELPPGDYLVETLSLHPDPAVSLLLHRFSPRPSSTE